MKKLIPDRQYRSGLAKLNWFDKCHTGKFHTVIKHRIDKLLSGELTSLIGVDDPTDNCFLSNQKGEY